MHRDWECFITNTDEVKLHNAQISIVVPLLLLLAGGVILWLTSSDSAGDFINYYFGSYFLKENLFSKAVYEPIDFNLLIGKYFTDPYFGNYTPVPPVSAFVILPFSFLPFYAAKATFTLLSLIWLCFSLHRLLVHLQIKTAYALLLPFAFIIPFKSNIEQGQLYFFLTALLIDGFLFDQKKLLLLSAFFFGIAISLKLFPAIIILYLLAKRNWKSILLTVVFTAVMSLLPLLFIDFHIVYDYYLDIVPRLFAGEINDPYATSYQSTSVLLRKLFVYDKLLNPEGLAHSAYAYRTLSVLGNFIVVALAFIVIKRSENDWFKFSFCLLAGILLSGYGTIYGMILLMPLFVYLLLETNILLPSAILVVSIFSVSIPTFPVPFTVMQFPRLSLLILFFIFLIYKKEKALIAIPLIYTAIVSATWLYFSRIGVTKPTDNYVLNSQKDLLLFDYQLSKDSIRLSYFSIEGVINTSIAFPSGINGKTELHVSDGPTTHTSPRLCRIKKLTRIPHKHLLLYLSDEGRGVGFYTLRQKTF